MLAENANATDLMSSACKIMVFYYHRSVTLSDYDQTNVAPDIVKNLIVVLELGWARTRLAYG